MRAGERSHVLALLPDWLACLTRDTRPGLSEATAPLSYDLPCSVLSQFLSVRGLHAFRHSVWYGGTTEFSACVFLCDIYEHLFWQHAWAWLLCLLSQAWISQHIWKPNVGHLMSTRVLFCMPMYDSMFVDQSLAFNRRHDKKTELSTEVKKKSISYVFILKRGC